MSNKLYQGHFARKRFGQNFLHDQNIIENIVAAINPKPQENLLEIGAGLGALTYPILERSDHLTIVEIDRDLVTRLQQDRQINQKIEVINADATEFNFATLRSTSQPKLKIFGNLPYNVSTPLLIHLFNFVEHIAEMTFMLQKEVVERLCAAPNSRAYGRLSIITQYFCHVIPVMEVPPNAFKPAPKVTSAVVKLLPRPEYPIKINNIKALSAITSQAFGQRRKTLRNSLQGIITKDVLDRLMIDSNARAENISVQQYCQLANLLTELTLSYQQSEPDHE